MDLNESRRRVGGEGEGEGRGGGGGWERKRKEGGSSKSKFALTLRIVNSMDSSAYYKCKYIVTVVMCNDRPVTALRTSAIRLDGSICRLTPQTLKQHFSQASLVIASRYPHGTPWVAGGPHGTPWVAGGAVQDIHMALPELQGALCKISTWHSLGCRGRCARMRSLGTSSWVSSAVP